MNKLYLTKSGTKMSLKTRSNIINIMTIVENDGLNQKEIATKANISISTLSNYLTNETWEDIRKLRLSAVSQELVKIDKAILTKAIKGDLASAKFVYSRWDEQQDALENLGDDETKTMEQIENEIAEIKKQIKQHIA